MTVKEQILAEARRIAAQGGSFVFPPLKPSLLPRQRQEGAKPGITATSKRPVDGPAGGSSHDAKRPRPASVEEKLFAAVPLPERPNVEWIKDSQVPIKTRQPTLNRLLGQHLAAGLLQSLKLDASVRPKSGQEAVRERPEIRSAAIAAARAQEMALYTACASSSTVYRNLAARTKAGTAVNHVPASSPAAIRQEPVSAAAVPEEPGKVDSHMASSMPVINSAPPEATHATVGSIKQEPPALGSIGHTSDHQGPRLPPFVSTSQRALTLLGMSKMLVRQPTSNLTCSNPTYKVLHMVELAHHGCTTSAIMPQAHYNRRRMPHLG
ncbi:hypothetical protein WJX84_010960 [Apatococcus fuscideae]|uniref:EKA-like protein n=1 Tax=Apatococcus fuscideae TaxID=2026836 RepID=A0AAW1S6Y1_9CHLO